MSDSWKKQSVRASWNEKIVPACPPGSSLFSFLLPLGWQKLKKNINHQNGWRWWWFNLLSLSAAKGYIPGMIQAAKVASNGLTVFCSDGKEFMVRTTFDMFHPYCIHVTFIWLWFLDGVKFPNRDVDAVECIMEHLDAFKKEIWRITSTMMTPTASTTEDSKESSTFSRYKLGCS